MHEQNKDSAESTARFLRAVQSVSDQMIRRIDERDRERQKSSDVATTPFQKAEKQG